MPREAYTVADAARDLGPVLDRAPSGAVTGRWTATTVQAGCSTRTGGYADAQGHLLDERPGRVLDAIEGVIERLEAAGAARFNEVVVRWAKARFPWQRSRVTVETRFDADIVPRAPVDPVYEAAAEARRRFWRGRGELVPGYAAERGVPNSFGQTRWFGPHRRVLLVRRPGEIVLATDGLSTPWAGIPDRENGVGCELVLRLAEAHDPLDCALEHIRLWADILIGVGDLVADGHRVTRDVEAHGAILFCGLPAECAPMAHMILSILGADTQDGTIDGLPFGPVRVLGATPVTEDEVASRGPDERWSATAAREALARRGFVLP